MVQDGCEVGPVVPWVVELVLAGPRELAALEQRRQEQEHLLPANNNTHSMRTTIADEKENLNITLQYLARTFPMQYLLPIPN